MHQFLLKIIEIDAYFMLRNFYVLT